jgi:hypothetical protein
LANQLFLKGPPSPAQRKALKEREERIRDLEGRMERLERLVEARKENEP